MKGLNENFVESVIKKCIDGVLTSKQAAVKLGVTKQYVNRLKKKYVEKGIDAFKHGNQGKDRKWKISESIESKILSLYEGKYSGFNYVHFLEKLNEIEGIKITYKPLYRILNSNGHKSPRKHKRKKEKNRHPSRPRKDCYGELLQIDASLHNWFGNDYPKATLHGAIDDATGTAMGLFFDKEETLRGYYEMCRQILTKYGIPAAFYGDRRTIFEYKILKEEDQTIDKNVHIQFKRMCQQLGIELITTSVSQAKGRIERLWGTLQSRLISELKIREIKTIEEANKYLPEFMAYFNKKFALEPNVETSLFAPPPSPKEIDFYLSIQYQRKADNGSSFSLFKKKIQLIDDNGEIAKVPPKLDVDIYVTLSGKMVAVYDNKLWSTIEIEKRNEDKKPIKKVGRPIWKPGPNHPWRNSLFFKKK